MDKSFDAGAAEARISAMWADTGAFRAGANASRPETFSIMIPPPNVTGALHVGHAFNNTLQDILTRWHRMRGFDTLWQPGTDHAGIATQLQVEKELARTQAPSRSELGRAAFLKKVWEWKGRYGDTIITQLKRLGASCDFSRTAFTMDDSFQRAVMKVFVDMHAKGLIFRGKRLVNWDPHFQTAISDLEVENVEVDGQMWHFKYPLAGGATYDYVEKDENGVETLREARDYISIATTRPETMLGDGAVAVHPDDARYAPIVGMLCEIPVGPKQHRRLIPIITDSYPDPAFGSGAVKITGAHDFNDYGVAQRNGIPMYRLMDGAGRMRDDGAPYAEAAARAQEIARAWLVRHGHAPAGFTEQPEPLDAAEVDTLNLVPDAYRGLDRFAARKAVVADIDAEGLAVMTRADDPRLGGTREKPAAPAAEPGPRAEVDQVPDQVRDGVDLVPLVEEKKIMQPFGDRSKVVVEPMLTDQWFVDAAKLAGPALEAVRDGRIEILPERDRKVYFHWLENIEPWCISRQLWWGHQVPVWYGLDLGTDIGDADDTGDLDEVDVLGLLVSGGMLHRGEVMHAAPDFAGVHDAFLAEIADIPHPLSNAAIVEVADKHAAIQILSERLADYAVNQDPTHLVYPVWRDPDVLDTWFSSGLWPIGTLGWPDETAEMAKYYPTSVLVTGADILFFWVARMVMMELEAVGQVPFRTVYLHALVRDEKGVKMSKTLGNVIDPLDLIDEFGADAVRFTMASMAALGGTLKLSRERVTGYRNFTTKLWNFARFAEMNGVFAAPRDGVPVAEHTVNRWIIGETARVAQAVDEALEGYRFNDAANALYAFVWGRVCDWYVEFSKPLLMDADAATKGETKAVMAWVLDQSLILLHPFMPFITEDLWSLTSVSRAKHLVHGDWPTLGGDLINAAADAELGWVIALIEAVRSARSEMNVPAGMQLAMLKLALDPAGEAAWAGNEALIRRLARVESLEPAAAAPKGSVTVTVEGGTFALPLAGIIDVAGERARLGKALERLEKDLAGLNGRLGNARFLASAPDEVVEETRDLARQKGDETARLRAALARLTEMV